MTGTGRRAQGRARELYPFSKYALSPVGKCRQALEKEGRQVSSLTLGFLSWMLYIDMHSIDSI